MGKEANKKAILTETPVELLGQSQPSLNVEDFDKALFSNGYEVVYENALKCPCKNIQVKTNLLDCQNCGGSGWFFINRTRTRLLSQSINRETKFLEWSEEDKGNIQITARFEDRLAFMDRIIFMDVDSIFNQVVRINVLRGKIWAKLFYAPLRIDDAFLFVDKEKPLKQLLFNTDYIVDYDKILFFNTNNNLFGGEDSIKEGKYTISVRYRHLATYSIIDSNRDILKSRARRCEYDGEEILEGMPFSYIARKTHYMFDDVDLFNESLFDNTYRQQKGTRVNTVKGMLGID